MAVRTATSTEPPLHFAHTQYGFDWGSASVTRVASDAAKGWVLISIATPKYPTGVQVYVTKTGKMRVLHNRSEWTPPLKGAR